tara:strand:+ start:565 stop:1044 length:480 start_codon:yes stop_codon:yes gene_type:complete
MKYCPQCKADMINREMDGVSRLACQSQNCDYVYWQNPTPVVAGIVEIEGKIVMAHNVAWPKEYFSVITGFLEQGEDPAEAMVRETKEELNLSVISQSLVGAYGFEQMNQVIIAYHLIAEGDIILNEELDAYKLIEKKDIVPWDMGTGLALKDFLANVSS